jgi:hypothetical protein
LRPTFRALQSSGRDKRLLKLADDPLNLSAAVNPPTSPPPVAIVAFLGLLQDTDSLLERNQKHRIYSRVCAIDRRMHAMTVTLSATS